MLFDFDQILYAESKKKRMEYVATWRGSEEISIGLVDMTFGQWWQGLIKKALFQGGDWVYLQTLQMSKDSLRWSSISCFSCLLYSTVPYLQTDGNYIHAPMNRWMVHIYTCFTCLVGSHMNAGYICRCRCRSTPMDRSSYYVFHVSDGPSQ